ncbi:MAG: hypothetical protein ABSE90_03730 [Verrucomicrobiota bacterium]|jgi:hypothetical protein
MNLVCPICEFGIPEKFIDLSEEKAFCPQCQKDFNCSGWIETALVVPGQLLHPPHSAWFAETANGFKLGVSTRSYDWIALIPVAAFLSGLMLFFTWGGFHATDREILMVLLLFLTPFYFLGLFLWICVLMSVCGKIEVVVDGESGTIFKGVGTVGWKRSFDWARVEKIRVANQYRRNCETRQKISIEGNEVIEFAAGIQFERLRFMFIALRLMFRKRGSARV